MKELIAQWLDKRDSFWKEEGRKEVIREIQRNKLIWVLSLTPENKAVWMELLKELGE